MSEKSQMFLGVLLLSCFQDEKLLFEARNICKGAPDCQCVKKLCTYINHLMGEVFGTLSCFQDNPSNEHLSLQLDTWSPTSFSSFPCTGLVWPQKEFMGQMHQTRAAAKNISLPHLDYAFLAS